VVQASKTVSRNSPLCNPLPATRSSVTLQKGSRFGAQEKLTNALNPSPAITSRSADRGFLGENPDISYTSSISITARKRMSLLADVETCSRGFGFLPFGQTPGKRKSALRSSRRLQLKDLRQIENIISRFPISRGHQRDRTTH
jgi:hypothetical protein